MNRYFIISNNYGAVVARDSLGSRFSFFRGQIQAENYIDDNLTFRLFANSEKDIWVSFNGTTAIPQYDSVELVCTVFEDFVYNNYDINKLSFDEIVNIFFQYLKNIYKEAFKTLDYRRIKIVIYIFYFDKIRFKMFEISYPELLEEDMPKVIEIKGYSIYPKYFMSDFVENRYAINEVDERYLNNKTEEEKRRIRAMFSSLPPLNIENLTIQNMIDLIKLNFFVFKECDRLFLFEKFIDPKPYTFLIFRPGKRSEKIVIEDLKL